MREQRRETSGSLQRGNEKEQGLLLHLGYKIKRWEHFLLRRNNLIIFQFMKSPEFCEAFKAS